MAGARVKFLCKKLILRGGGCPDGVEVPCAVGPMYDEEEGQLNIHNDMFDWDVGKLKHHIWQNYLIFLFRLTPWLSYRLFLEYPPRHPGEESYMKKLRDDELLSTYRHDMARIRRIVLLWDLEPSLE